MRTHAHVKRCLKHFLGTVDHKSFQLADITNLSQQPLVHELFKEYLKVLNRLYDLTWFGAVYA
jgi:hypothetical protein